jgi:drug/metabolite transporter (DMT)-like permease
LCAGVAIFSVQDIIIRLVSAELPAHEFILIRTAFSFVPLAVLVHLEGGFGVLRVHRPGLHLLRGVILLASYTCWYLAIASLPIAEAVAIYMSTPLWITALAVILLGERVDGRRWAALAVGFVGVLIVIRPGTEAFRLGGLFALAGAAFYGISAILARRIGRTDSSVSMVFSMSLVYLAGTLAWGAVLGDGATTTSPTLHYLFRPWAVPTWGALGAMVLCAIVAIAGFYGLVQAYRLAPAGVVAPFEFTAIAWGALWGFALWDEVPDRLAMLGVAIVVASGLYLLHRERVASRADR